MLKLLDRLPPELREAPDQVQSGYRLLSAWVRYGKYRQVPPELRDSRVGYHIARAIWDYRKDDFVKAVGINEEQIASYELNPERTPRVVINRRDVVLGQMATTMLEGYVEVQELTRSQVNPRSPEQT